ncbi:MAG: DNA-3-methyladenine glycosylase 2 family protein [Proteobacteria bacterium]|nr:DNA-3-methyladenine glycosylase 2 family protein [Pseudomonadota bacterium]
MDFYDPLPPEARLALHTALRRFLGLEQPLRAFYRAMEGDAVMGPVIRRNRGLRIPQVPSLWEALCWAVIGQQINLTFAYRLRNRFIALGNGLDGAGEGIPDASGGPLPFPTPGQVLTIPDPAWRPAQFSRQKTAYLAGLARAFEEGTLSQSALESAPLEEAEATLRAVKGLGPWSVAYGMLRALGRVDAFPVGDAGLRSALRHHYRLEANPDANAQLEEQAEFDADGGPEGTVELDGDGDGELESYGELEDGDEFDAQSDLGTDTDES